MLEAFANFSSTFQPEVGELLAEGVWYTEFTKFKLSIIKRWDENGIRFLSDLIDSYTGKLHTKESLEQNKLRQNEKNGVELLEADFDFPNRNVRPDNYQTS